MGAFRGFDSRRLHQIAMSPIVLVEVSTHGIRGATTDLTADHAVPIATGGHSRTARGRSIVCAAADA